jgi:hypothetical protein
VSLNRTPHAVGGFSSVYKGTFLIENPIYTKKISLPYELIKKKPDKEKDIYAHLYKVCENERMIQASL